MRSRKIGKWPHIGHELYPVWWLQNYWDYKESGAYILRSQYMNTVFAVKKFRTNHLHKVSKSSLKKMYDTYHNKYLWRNCRDRKKIVAFTLLYWSDLLTWYRVRSAHDVKLAVHSTVNLQKSTFLKYLSWIFPEKNCRVHISLYRVHC